MPDPQSPHVNQQPDRDADFRHRPAPHPSGNVATDTTPTQEGPGIGESAWADPGASPVVKGEAKAGGADGSHPHLFHLADATANVFPGGGLQGAHERKTGLSLKARTALST